MMGRASKRKAERRAEGLPSLSEIMTEERVRELAATDKGRATLQGMLRLIEQRLPGDERQCEETIAHIQRRAAETAELYANLEAKARAEFEAARQRDRDTVERIKAALSELAA